MRSSMLQKVKCLALAYEFLPDTCRHSACNHAVLIKDLLQRLTLIIQNKPTNQAFLVQQAVKSRENLIFEGKLHYPK